MNNINIYFVLLFTSFKFCFAIELYLQRVAIIETIENKLIDIMLGQPKCKVSYAYMCV